MYSVGVKYSNAASHVLNGIYRHVLTCNINLMYYWQFWIKALELLCMIIPLAICTCTCTCTLYGQFAKITMLMSKIAYNEKISCLEI